MRERLVGFARADHARPGRMGGWMAAVILMAALLSGCASQGARPTATATRTATPAPTATADPWAAYGLSVAGTQIVNGRGQPVTLVGVARYSLEYLCGGDGHLGMADFQAMRAWGANTVRIPLSSAFWRDVGGTCPTYQTTVLATVATAEAAGLYVVLTLQRDAPFGYASDGVTGGAQCPLPDAHDVAMWQDLATLYNHDPRVLFDVFSEPNNITWDQWFNGGPITAACYTYGAAATYQAVGMPALAAAVRAIAPRNIIILSGLGWGYDLSGVNPGNAVNLPNILYATHPWGHATIQRPSDWARAFGATAAHLPVIATEFGQYDCQTSYIGPEIAYFQQLHVSFLAWAWTTGNCLIPSLLANWDGTPSQPYGAFIQQQIQQAAKANPPGF